MAHSIVLQSATLHRLLTAEPLVLQIPLSVLKAWTMQILAGLADLQECGVAHGDLKPVSLVSAHGNLS